MKFFKLLPILFLLCACTKKGDSPSQVKEISLGGETMGTTFSVKYYPAESTPDQKVVLDAINSLLVAVNKEMSTYMENSEILQFNGLKTTDSWFKVSPGFHWVVKVALGLAEKTQGVYDPTIGPLVNLWGFGPKKSKVLLSADQIQAVMTKIGYAKVIAHETEPMLRKTEPGVELDLSSIAKGWGVDQVGRYLDSVGVKHYFVEIGGEVKTLGGKPDGAAWAIGINSPSLEATNDLQKIVQFQSGALATSGDYRNYFTVNGQRYAHIIDPLTGNSSKSDLASVSVYDENGDCTLVDGLATALFAMGSEAAINFATANQLAVYLVIHGDTNTEFKEWVSPKFESLYKK